MMKGKGIRNIGIILISAVLVSVILNNIVYSQAEPEYGELKVGDKVPDLLLENLINYPAKTANLSDFRGKWVILDFWGQYCASCIASWPKLMKLQEQFKDEMQIIIMNPRDDKSRVREIFDKREKAIHKEITLLAANHGDYSESLLKLFPYTSVPHVVWIDRDGIVRAITGSGPLNEKNIRSVLTGEGKVNIAQKYINQEPIPLVRSEPLFIHKNGGEPERVLWQSVFAKTEQRLPVGSAIIQDAVGNSHAYASNCTITELYRLAYTNNLHGRPQMMPPKYIWLNIEDSTRYYAASIEEGFMRQNRYTYHLTAPPGTTAEKLQERMQSDLGDYIGLEAVWEKQVRPCLVLKTGDTSRIRYKSGKNTAQTNGLDYMKINKISIAKFFRFLEHNFPEYYRGPVFINETGYDGLLGQVEVRENIGDVHALNKALEKYALKFSQENREVDILKLREPRGYLFSYDKEPTERQQLHQAANELKVLIHKAEYEKDWDTYAKQVIRYVNNYIEPGHGERYRYARIIASNPDIQDKSVLVEVSNWVNHEAVEKLKKENKNLYQYCMFTYARLLYKMEQYNEALAAADNAIRAAEDIGFEGTVKQISEFMEKVKHKL